MNAPRYFWASHSAVTIGFPRRWSKESACQCKESRDKRCLPVLAWELPWWREPGQGLQSVRRVAKSSDMTRWEFNMEIRAKPWYFRGALQAPVAWGFLWLWSRTALQMRDSLPDPHKDPERRENTHSSILPEDLHARCIVHGLKSRDTTERFPTTTSEEPACQCGRLRDAFDPGSGRSPGYETGQTTQHSSENPGGWAHGQSLRAQWVWSRNWRASTYGRRLARVVAWRPEKSRGGAPGRTQGRGSAGCARRREGGSGAAGRGGCSGRGYRRAGSSTSEGAARAGVEASWSIRGRGLLSRRFGRLPSDTSPPGVGAVGAVAPGSQVREWRRQWGRPRPLASAAPRLRLLPQGPRRRRCAPRRGSPSSRSVPGDAGLSSSRRRFLGVSPASLSPARPGEGPRTNSSLGWCPSETKHQPLCHGTFGTRPRRWPRWGWRAEFGAVSSVLRLAGYQRYDTFCCLWKLVEFKVI